MTTAARARQLRAKAEREQIGFAAMDDVLTALETHPTLWHRLEHGMGEPAQGGDTAPYAYDPRIYRR